MKILQISDIHWTKRRHWEEDYPGMKSKFRDDIKEYIEAGNQIDYVFICGDVVFKGIKEEYDKALSYIDDLCGIIGCSRKEVFVVPGNHDLSRDFAAHLQREMMNAALAFEPSNNSFLDNVILKSKELRKTQFDAFKDYNNFAKVFLCHEKVMDKCINGGDDAITDNDELFYHTQLSKKVGDFTVSVRGVNTALNCDAWDWNEKYKDGHLQILPQRAYVLEKEEKQEVKILMGHHPTSFLTSRTKVEEYLNCHYHIQLFGHVHIQNIQGDNYVRVLSGALNPPPDKKEPGKYKPIYNIVELSPLDETHIKVTGESQIWDRNKFIRYDEGCFEKVIEIELNKNKWESPKMTRHDNIDIRGVKFAFLQRGDRVSFFDKIDDVPFTPKAGKPEYDQCLDFLDAVEKAGKLSQLNELMK